MSGERADRDPGSRQDEERGESALPSGGRGEDAQRDAGRAPDEPEVPGFVDWKHAIAGGAVGALLLGFVFLGVGLVGSGQARVLLESAVPAIRFLTSSVMAAGATILALMLTLLGLTQASDQPASWAA